MMDLREKKTKRNIAGAFLQLRTQKPLERITVKELAQLAEISKATFYLHYRDVYDLSQQMQEEVIRDILANVTHPEYCLSDQRAFTEELFCAFRAQQSRIDILFSGMQKALLPTRVEEELRTFIAKRYGALSKPYDMLLTYRIQGAHAVYQRFCRTHGAEEIAALVGAASEAVESVTLQA